MSESTRRWVACTILAMALAVRSGGAWWWQQRLGDAGALGMPDSYSYWELGQRIAAGRPYEYGGADLRIFRTPAYPVLLAGLFAIVGDDPPVMWARCIGAALGTLTVGLVIGMGRMLFGSVAGLVAGALVAVYPGAIAMSVFVLAEALFCPLMVLQLMAWIAAWRASTRRGDRRGGCRGCRGRVGRLGASQLVAVHSIHGRVSGVGQPRTLAACVDQRVAGRRVLRGDESLVDAELSGVG